MFGHKKNISNIIFFSLVEGPRKKKLPRVEGPSFWRYGRLGLRLQKKVSFFNAVLFAKKTCFFLFLFFYNHKKYKILWNIIIIFCEMNFMHRYEIYLLKMELVYNTISMPVFVSSWYDQGVTNGKNLKFVKAIFSIISLLMF